MFFEKIALTKKFFKKFSSHFYPRNPSPMGGVDLTTNYVCTIFWCLKSSVFGFGDIFVTYQGPFRRDLLPEIVTKAFWGLTFFGTF